MDAVYQRLAKHLDDLPAGFPATPTGVELRILNRLFTPDEARTATVLSMFLEPAAAIAARLSRDVTELTRQLDAMARKGLIFRAVKKGQPHYMAAQFVIGIWEYHVNDLDPELIRDFNEYVPFLMEKSWLPSRTKQLRVVPVSRSVDAEIRVMPYERAEELIRQQSKIVVAPCICRKEHTMIGQGCSKPLETCLIFGSGAAYYEDNGLGRPVTIEDALDILTEAIDAGLVLQPGNAQQPANICMCCGCCCQILKNLNALPAPANVVESNYHAEVMEQRCSACGICVSRCQMEAIEIDATAQVDLNRCIGCGLCVITCEDDAMRLHLKAEPEQSVPPKTLFHTYLSLAKERGKI